MSVLSWELLLEEASAIARQNREAMELLARLKEERKKQDRCPHCGSEGYSQRQKL